MYEIRHSTIVVRVAGNDESLIYVRGPLESVIQIVVRDKRRSTIVILPITIVKLPIVVILPVIVTKLINEYRVPKIESNA